MQKDGTVAVSSERVIFLAVFSIPLGILVSAISCWAFAPRAGDNIDGYQIAMQLQGKACTKRMNLKAKFGNPPALAASILTAGNAYPYM